ncbi:MAG TPA: phenylacetate--CoA ligase [Firmicutes bacterium]|nr:phenylacetate--CoA ligase [Bacillota bacterium]
MAVNQAELSRENLIFTGSEREEKQFQRERAEKMSRVVKYAAKNSPFYRRKLTEAGIDPAGIKTFEDLQSLPFTTKEELRLAYPLQAQAAPDDEVVRVHSSSGTTGKPVIIPYTQYDVDTWAEMMARCLKMTGVNRLDRVQVTPGYGLWTAGIGFQAGVERLGAMTIPTGPGNTEKQLEMMSDLGTTVLIGTSSYGLLLAEECSKRGVLDRIRLRIGIFGSERWGERMRARIEEIFAIDTFDIYGLTEIYGPGIAIDCPYHHGLHYWDDHLFFEVIDPVTGKVVPDGVQGELVVTTLTKQGMPLLRYRTRDLTRIITEPCPCGSPYPQIDRIFARTDDMIKIHGVNIYPGQLEHVLQITSGLSSEYEITITRKEGRDSLIIKVESTEGPEVWEHLGTSLARNIKTKIGISAQCIVTEIGALRRSEKKTKRVYDLRKSEL